MVKIVKLQWKGGKGKVPDIFQGYFVRVKEKYFPVFVEESFITKEDNNIFSEIEVEIKGNGGYTQ